MGRGAVDELRARGIRSALLGPVDHLGDAVAGFEVLDAHGLGPVLRFGAGAGGGVGPRGGRGGGVGALRGLVRGGVRGVGRGRGGGTSGGGAHRLLVAGAEAHGEEECRREGDEG